MTVKRQWMLVLIFSAIISVVINSLVLSTLINSYFQDNTRKNYETHYEQIVKFSREALVEQYSSQQLALQLETHLIDPIVRIKLYDANGDLLADVGSRFNMNMMNGRGNMMGKKWMYRMLGSQTEEVDSSVITVNGMTLGRLDIVRYSSIADSTQSRMFIISLIGNSILSFVIVLILMLIIGSGISRRMSKDLMNTAALAASIDLGSENNIEKSKVREILVIQQSLETLRSKLKLKQVSRKRLLDELVHQTRTPLTILKTHLEGFEDGVLEMTPDEIKTCEAQIESITMTIANMSAMIDAEQNLDTIKIEDVEINQLLKQIVGALKNQFTKKQIDLNLLNHQKIMIKTDQYKLSQSIYNILTNAYKFTEQNGKVSVSYEKVGTGLKIVIEDTGSGIRDEDKEHLFDAYYRAPNTSNIPGEGIGLYIVKENLNQINGSIEVESQVGKGSKFIFTMPV